MGSTQKTDTLVFYVNGKEVVEQNADPEMTLLTYLRTKLSLTGTKLGCGEGGCGACTVMISSYDRIKKKIIHISANACLAPVCAMHGSSVTTVEGIGSTKTQLHPVQERIAKSHGSQCGFCTPGIVMSMYTLLRNNPQPSQLEMEHAFEGNLCRCTGYRPILEGFKTLTKEFQCGMGENCCRNQVNGTASCNDAETEMPKNLLQDSGFAPYESSQEPIFPSKLQLSDAYDSQSLMFAGHRTMWYRPTTLEQLLTLKNDHPQARLVIGNTEVGVEMKFKNLHYPVLIAASHIEELRTVSVTDTGIKFGGSVTLSDLEHTLKESIVKLPEHQTRVFAAIVEMLRWFAGHQIRNVAAIAGNIITASPISDLNPLFLSAACKLELASKEGGIRTVTMDHTFFPGYRKTQLRPDEILLSITIPYTQQHEYFWGYKQAHRREDDIAIVNAGFRVQFEPATSTIQEMAMSFGGMAPFTVMATKTATAMIGRKWDDALIPDVCKWLGEELGLNPGTPGGMESYRNTLTTSFFFKFYLSVIQQLNKSCPDVTSISERNQSATTLYERDMTHGVQYYEEVDESQDPDDSCGRPMAHLSGTKQATGEAIYCDDIPVYRNELYMALVWSTKAHANVLSVDTSHALTMPGVHTYLSAVDVPGSNLTGAIIMDEEVFATKTVVCEGQPIGAIIAETQVQAQKAAKAVKVTYEELTPIVTIEQAIAAKSFAAPVKVFKTGDIREGFAAADHIIEDEVRLGAQEHFYLETQACVAVPHEDHEMEIFSSCQSPSKAQFQVADVLGIPSNRVKCRVKRLGGGFGGKETRYVIPMLHCAVAANKLQRPIRCMLDRDEDMASSGTRHPYLGRYKVGFTKDGVITALELKMYANIGCSLDLSLAVMDRALFSLDGGYRIPHLYCEAYLCKTNLPSNTAFRGFGAPQGMFIAETWVDHMARTLSMDPDRVRLLNLYRRNDKTHIHYVLDDCTLKECWNDVVRKSDYHARKHQVQEFNKLNRWKKRGIYLIPTKFGISFTISHLNQAGALLHVYVDGSVRLTHGGVEIGQGLHTKMIQVASRALEVPVDKIYVSETSTELVPNTSATAASTGSDLNGMAVMNACHTIKERLEPFKKKNPNGTWEDWVTDAYENSVSLSTTGFHRTDGIAFNYETCRGHVFNYHCYGASCSEVEIDCLTGDHTVLRTDIVMDVGRSLNPAIDIGQIEGAFAQGYGMFTLEEQRYSPSGLLLTRGPGFYKIPGFGDVPVEFNVSILKGGNNPKAIYSSRAVGEPPLFLASSVFFAIKNAITAAREESGHEGFFRLDSPATAERIRMACEDNFTEQFPQPTPGTFKPWYVQL